MRVPQLLDFPRLSMCTWSECIRHHGSKTTQCRNNHPLALLQPLLDASSGHHEQRFLPRPSRYRTSHKTTLSSLPSSVPCNTINDAVALTHERPRPVRGFTTAVNKRPSASELSRPTLNKQRSRTRQLSRATATTEGKKTSMAITRKCRAPLSITRLLCLLTMPFF